MNPDLSFNRETTAEAFSVESGERIGPESGAPSINKSHDSSVLPCRPRRNHDRVRRDGNQNLACGWLDVGSINSCLRALPAPVEKTEECRLD
jgi:hypothetical protein